jgi:hypothetical protein
MRIMSAKALIKVVFIFTIAFMLRGELKAQDNPKMEFSFGFINNQSLSVGNSLNRGLGVGLGYNWSRNIFSDLHVNYYLSRQEINAEVMEFAPGVSFNGNNGIIKENINRTMAGLHIGYRLFPISTFSVGVYAKLSYQQLNRSISDEEQLLSEPAFNWYILQFGERSGICPGAGLRIDWNVSKTFSLRINIENNDINNTLMAEKDNRLIENVQIADGAISELRGRKNVYSPVDASLHFVFKLGQR